MPTALSTQSKKLYLDGWSTKAISAQFHTKNNSIVRLIQRNKFSKKSSSSIKSWERKRKHFFNFDKINFDEIDKNKAKLYAALLYWCEGSKYPASTALNFTTSDMKMQKLFLSLLRKGFDPVESKFRVWLQFHSDQDRQKIFRYWSTTLRIPLSQFIKPKITNKNGNRYRRIYHGTCSLKYNDYSIILRLTGIYQSFYKQALSSLV